MTGAKIWYANRNSEAGQTFGRNASFDLRDDGPLTPAEVVNNHRITHVKVCDAAWDGDAEALYAAFQGENLTLEGGRAIARRAGYTSMSVGDIIETPDAWHVVMPAGFARIPKPEAGGNPPAADTAIRDALKAATHAFHAVEHALERTAYPPLRGHLASARTALANVGGHLEAAQEANAELLADDPRR